MVFVFLKHPDFLESQSMPRFAAMLSQGMMDKGHQVEVLTARPLFFNLPVPKSLKKWMGYIDQYVMFPAKLRNRLRNDRYDTFYIFTDHALGPWMPMVANRAHVVHCHDFLAQLSALDKIPENKTGWTGRRYQSFIRRGYSKAKNFISVSKLTRTHLHEFLGHEPDVSEVVYNGLNQAFTVQNVELCRKILGDYIGIDLSKGYILHVGGNQWYKNRLGVISIYNAWRDKTKQNLPLIMIGQPPSVAISEAHATSNYKDSIHLVTGAKDDLVKKAYSGASVLLFPSIAEGFGWPIVEAMASGCPVITTNAEPMTEVAGDAAFLIPVKPYPVTEQQAWAQNSAGILDKVINLLDGEREELINKGLLNAARFNKNEALDSIENIYINIIEDFKTKNKIL